ncbi:MAG TPA: putative inorganic carbon transporter subunit DabA, partial [Pirellulales bacterium]
MSQLERLHEAITAAAELLPTTGPITSFAFLNTLSALEDMPFEEGIEHGAELYGCQPWLSEERYRTFIAEHRIDPDDLATVLYESLRQNGESRVGPLCSRFDLRSAMLKYALPSGPLAELRWFIEENNSLSKFRDDVSTGVKRQLLEETRQWLMTEVVSAKPTSNQTADPYLAVVSELAQE